MRGVVFAGIFQLFIFFPAKLAESPIYGRPSERASRFEFTFSPTVTKEKLERVEVGAGAWIDSVQFHTNLRSTVRLGGEGGSRAEFKLQEGGVFLSDVCWIGTADRYVTSLFMMDVVIDSVETPLP